MAHVVFTQNLQRHVTCLPSHAPGRTVRDVLNAVFTGNERLRGYVVDEQGALRQHMIVFIDGEQIRDREKLSDPVSENTEVCARKEARTSTAKASQRLL